MEWAGARYADQPTVEVQTWDDAPPERVWPLVSDPIAMPEMCTAVQRIEWAGPSIALEAMPDKEQKIVFVRCASSRQP
jgi:hypothetical protein